MSSGSGVCSRRSGLRGAGRDGSSGAGACSAAQSPRLRGPRALPPRSLPPPPPRLPPPPPPRVTPPLPLPLLPSRPPPPPPLQLLPPPLQPRPPLPPPRPPLCSPSRTRPPPPPPLLLLLLAERCGYQPEPDPPPSALELNARLVSACATAGVAAHLVRQCSELAIVVGTAATAACRQRRAARRSMAECGCAADLTLFSSTFFCFRLVGFWSALLLQFHHHAHRNHLWTSWLVNPHLCRRCGVDRP